MKKYRVLLIGDAHICEEYCAEDIVLPETDLAIVLGDWVNSGAEDEYQLGVAWAKKISCPVLVVRGNHDNGLWQRHVKNVIPEAGKKQLENNSPVENPVMVEWAPMVWQEYDGTIMNFPRESAWKDFLLPVQDRIIKLRDNSEDYYAFDSGEILFICIDTSNWLLGKKQMSWLEKQVAESDKPIVIAGHHHFLPVDIQYDTCQVHERDFMRRLVTENDSIIACLHGHAHQDWWWDYAGKDIMGIRNRTSRVIEFADGKSLGFIDDNGPTESKAFFPDYLCCQDMSPGGTVIPRPNNFHNPWGIAETPCLGWQPETKKDLQWSLRLPKNISGESKSLVIQIANQGECSFEIITPGDSTPTEKTVPPAPDGQEVSLPLGNLEAGYYQVRLIATEGWGYVAMAAMIVNI